MLLGCNLAVVDAYGVGNVAVFTVTFVAKAELQSAGHAECRGLPWTSCSPSLDKHAWSLRVSAKQNRHSSSLTHGWSSLYANS